MSDHTPPPPPPPYGGGSNPPPPPPPGGGYGGGYQQPGQYPPQGGPYQGGPGPGYREAPAGPGYPGQYPPGMPPGAPPKKRGMLPWILGCGGCGLLIVIALVVFGGIGYFARKAEQAGAGGTRTAVDESNTTLYTATADGLGSNLRDKFVPFSFRYPEGWTVSERGAAADAQNFVKVERSNGGTTAENFAVGYLTLPAGQENDPALLTQLLSQLEQQFSAQFSGFQRVGDDRMTLGGHQATGFRFTGKMGEIDIFGRVLLLPVGDGRGLSIVMLGTPVQSGLSSVDDLGEKGGLPVILRSFSVGEGAEGAAASEATSTEGTSSEGGVEDKPTSTEETSSSDAAPSDDDAPASDAEPDIKEIKPLSP